MTLKYKNWYFFLKTSKSPCNSTIAYHCSRIKSFKSYEKTNLPQKQNNHKIYKWKKLFILNFLFGYKKKIIVQNLKFWKTIKTSELILSRMELINVEIKQVQISADFTFGYHIWLSWLQIKVLLSIPITCVKVYGAAPTSPRRALFNRGNHLPNTNQSM